VESLSDEQAESLEEAQVRSLESLVLLTLCSTIAAACRQASMLAAGKGKEGKD